MGRIIQRGQPGDGIIARQPRRDGEDESGGEEGGVRNPFFPVRPENKQGQQNHTRREERGLSPQEQLQAERAARGEREEQSTAFLAKPAQDEKQIRDQNEGSDEFREQHFRVADTRVRSHPQTGQLAKDGEQGNRQPCGAAAQLLAEKIQRDRQKREDQSLPEDEARVFLSEQGVQACQEKDEQRARGNWVDKSVAHQKALRVRVVIGCVRGGKGLAIRRLDGRVETVAERGQRDAHPQADGEEPDEKWKEEGSKT